jgi:hypothetical protein
VSFAAITLCVTSQQVIPKVSVYFVMTQSGNFWIHPRVLQINYLLFVHLQERFAESETMLGTYSASKKTDSGMKSKLKDKN